MQINLPDSTAPLYFPCPFMNENVKSPRGPRLNTTMLFYSSSSSADKLAASPFIQMAQNGSIVATFNCSQQLTMKIETLRLAIITWYAPSFHPNSSYKLGYLSIGNN